MHQRVTSAAWGALPVKGFGPNHSYAPPRPECASRSHVATLLAWALDPAVAVMLGTPYAHRLVYAIQVPDDEHGEWDVCVTSPACRAMLARTGMTSTNHSCVHMLSTGLAGVVQCRGLCHTIWLLACTHLSTPSSMSLSAFHTSATLRHWPVVPVVMHPTKREQIAQTIGWAWVASAATQQPMTENESRQEPAATMNGCSRR